MSYLLQYATRPPPVGVASLDDEAPLNRPGLYGDAYVRVFVEDTTAPATPAQPGPRLTLRIADCANTINLEFSLDSPELRENSLFKIDTLLDALHRFRDGLAAEADARRAARHTHDHERRCT